jgi:hypothetical protein
MPTVSAMRLAGLARKPSPAVMVVLTANAAGSAIVREEIGFAVGRASLSSSSSRRPSRRSPLRWDAQRAGSASL